MALAAPAAAREARHPRGPPRRGQDHRRRRPRCSGQHRRADAVRNRWRAPTGVVLLSAEDGLADTIRPRLEAAGADLTRIVSAKLDELPTLDEAGLAYIHALVERVQATLIILDPLMAFVPDAVDTYKDHHARRLLRKLALAEETGATVLVLRHVRKGAALNAKDAGGGSTGFTAAARVVLLAAGDPDDETTKVLARVKGNLRAPSPRSGIGSSAPA